MTETQALKAMLLVALMDLNCIVKQCNDEVSCMICKHYSDSERKCIAKQDDLCEWRFAKEIGELVK